LNWTKEEEKREKIWKLLLDLKTVDSRKVGEEGDR
jgi:hypothetical protein